MSGNDPGHWADRRRQLRAQEPAPAQAGVPDPKAFRSGRHFAAWIGITPRENSTAGKHRTGKISREGDERLRRRRPGMARIIGAMMVSGETYRRPKEA